MTSGIYEILNTANGKRYIGQSARIRARWNYHRGQLRKNKSCHKYLQAAWIKYGEAAFRFSILGLCARQHLTFFEQAWMDARKPEYNLAPAAGSVLGVTRSAETRAKIGTAKRGNKYWLGKKHTPETKEKMSRLQRDKPGKPRTAESRAKQSAATRGVPKSAEHRAKIAAAHKGKTHPFRTLGPQTDQHRANIAAGKRRGAQLRKEKLC